ncbi:restriction endonuclease subunit S [Streptococcus parasuis]|uniref:restriction endonuclease subunit S n=1 Tax=Streptococcus parasuis TaxID=1501662 RepID=UPI0028A9E4D3|nr:restriction endonuclease subunit S [Streptococcus parasuis]
MPNKDRNIPKRRFKEFENADAWELRKLGELTSYRNGKGYEDNQSDFGKYELINLNSISIEGGLKPSGKFINSASETLNKNDLVMVLSDVGHGDLLGRVAIIPEDDRFVLNQRVALLRNNDYADCKYLFAYINANQHYFKLQGAGSSQLNISKKAVENFVVHIPSQKEQSAIGTFFSTLDQQITLHQRKLDKLKSVKQAYLSEMFPAEGERVPKRRFPGFTDAWELRNVGEICRISTGKSNTQDREEQGKFPFYVRSPIIEKSTKYLFDEEAVLTVGDGVGTGKVFHYVHGKYDLHQRVYRMFSFTHVNAKYFYYYFSKKFFDRVMAMTAKNSVDSVRLEMISDMEITIPQLEEQEKIVKILSTLDQQITLHQRKLEKLKNLKKALLNELFV